MNSQSHIKLTESEHDCSLRFGHLIIGPSSESRCLCTYKAFMDAHAHDASGQSMKLMCRHNKAGCIFHNMT